MSNTVILTTTMNYKQKISDFNRDTDIISLVERYERISLWDAMGVGRREMSHSSFLGELLKEDSLHELGNLPIQWLLDLLLDKANVQDRKKAEDESEYPDDDEYAEDHRWSDVMVNIPAELQRAILCHKLNPHNVSVRKEYCIPGGRVDLMVELDVDEVETERDNKPIRHLTIIIENKINSREHCDQTETYYKHFQSQSNDNGNYIFYVYLTPAPTRALKCCGVLPFCRQKQFIQINYQNILDHIVLPALSLTKETSPSYYTLLEYKKALGISFDNIETKGKKSRMQCMVMAVESKDVEDVRKVRAEFGELMADSKKAKRGEFRIEGEPQRQLYQWDGQIYDRTHLVHAFLSSYAETRTFDEVIETFGILKRKTDGNDVLKDVNTECSDSYYYKEAEIVTRDDVHCWSLRQWPDVKFNEFRSAAKEWGYSIEDYQCDMISREDNDLLISFYDKHAKFIAASEAILEFVDGKDEDSMPLPF